MIHNTQSAQISQKQHERNIYICNHENNVPCRLSAQWLCGNSCTWAHDVRLHIAGTTYITLLALLVEHSLVHWYQQCVTVHHVPKCMSCHKAIVVITGRAHCFHDYIYILRSSCFCEI